MGVSMWPVRWLRGRYAWAGYALLGSAILGGAIVVRWTALQVRAVHRLTRGVGDTVFYGADGQPWFRLEEQRHDVPLDRISLDLQHAVIAVEDRRFYDHPGIDPIGVARAVVRDIRSGGRVEGGSTLTQQLARTLFLSNVRTFGRKIKEAALALLIEAQLTKAQILELYLNRVYLSGGVYGVEAMSAHLYRKSASDLTLPEVALIAGLIRAPSTLSPWTNYEGALARSQLVLRQMREQRFITEAQEEAARGVKPRIEPFRSPDDLRAAWAKDFLRQQFRNQFGGDGPPDWQVHTSFWPSMQDAAERAVAAGVRRSGRPGLQAALVAIDPATGNLLALVGGTNYATSSFNRATRARRQPGSAFKPFVYAAALSHGYSPVSVLTDLDRVDAAGDPEWQPRNVSHADGEDPGSLTLRTALAESNNAAAAVLQQQVTTKEVLRVAEDAGLHDLPNVPSLALGTGLVTPIDLTAAYTMFPGGGAVVRPRGMLQVFDAGGSLVFDEPIERTPVLSEPVAFQMVALLRGVVDSGTATAARTLGVAGPIAGKTGTTDDYHDAWFVGFSPSVVVGVWAGLDQPAPIGRDAYGARIALPIWADFMKRIAKDLPAQEFAVPSDIHAELLCSVSHLRPLGDCPVYTEYFKTGDAVPSELCRIHGGAMARASARIEGFFKGLGSRIAGLFRRR
jgi:penicillin-binding protein 1A